MLALSAKASVKIYVTASEAELAKRRKGEVDTKSLVGQLRLYDTLAKLVKCHEVDTTDKDMKASLQEVLNLLGMR
jgi:cytidylate kinase